MIQPIHNRLIIFSDAISHVPYISSKAHLARPAPRTFQTLLNLLRRPSMLRVRPHQDIKHTLLVSDLGELVTAHGDRHASCVHGWRSAAVEDRHTADALYYCVDFGLEC